MWTRIIVMEDDMVPFERSFRLDWTVKAIKLSHVGVVVDVQLSLAIFVQNIPLLTLLSVVQSVTSTI